MNLQPITPQDLTLETYRINEIFESIQGEGPWQGHSVIFIRLAGCNLCCTWCDTEYSTRFTRSLAQLMLHVNKLSSRETAHRVVITGGEPFAQDLVPLVNALWENGTAIQIETNGTLTNPGFPWEKATIVCSPKAGKIHSDIIDHCVCFKYVVAADELDFRTMLPNTPTQEKGKRGPPVPPEINADYIWVMPRDGNSDKQQQRNEKQAMECCHVRGYRFSGRLHKILGIR